MKLKSTITNGAKAFAVVAVLSFTGLGMAQAGRFIGPLPPIIVGYETDLPGSKLLVGVGPKATPTPAPPVLDVPPAIKAVKR